MMTAAQGKSKDMKDLLKPWQSLYEREPDAKAGINALIRDFGTTI